MGDDNRTAVSDEEAMKAAYCDWIEDQRGPDGMARPVFIDVWRAAVRWAAARRDVRGGREAQLEAAIRDIDAHSAPLGEDEDGFVATGYVVSLGAMHRALAVLQGASHPLERADSERDA